MNIIIQQATIHLRKTIFILFFLGIGINLCFPQTESEKRFGLTEFDSEKYNQIYRVQIEDYQNVELIDFKNGEFKGTLTHSVWITNKKGVKKDSITQKIAIPNSIVEKLISELNTHGFTNLKNCNAIENCISGLDGTTTFFKTIKDGEINSASYWELESDYCYNQNNVKLPTEVIKARKLIAIINREFDLKAQFQNFLNRLSKGRYAFNMQMMQKL